MFPSTDSTLRPARSASEGGTAPDVQLLADEATNSLLVSADGELLAQLKDLIVALDSGRTPGS